MNRSSDAVEILLVEDTPADAELTTLALKKHCLINNLLWVKDGPEALDFLFAEGIHAGRDCAAKPKVVLLDLRLPRLSGIEVLRRIKNDERTRSIPVVVLTSSKEDVDIDECYRLGVNSYITKPVSFDEFVKVVGELGLYWLLLNKGPHEGPKCRTSRTS
jgi:CheY-like chemotaxis protein